MKFTASKKTIALVAAAAMLTSVAACGSSSNSSSSGVTEGGKTEIKVRQIWCRLSIMHFPNIRFVERLKT